MNTAQRITDEELDYREFEHEVIDEDLDRTDGAGWGIYEFKDGSILYFDISGDYAFKDYGAFKPLEDELRKHLEREEEERKEKSFYRGER